MEALPLVNSVQRLEATTEAYRSNIKYNFW
jgi:hypothetical protein